MSNFGPVTSRYCVECGDERLFEQPPCLDGHADCPEWVCVACGSGYVVGWLEIDAPHPVRAPHTDSGRGAA